jgi:hypothetical protein
MNNRLMLLLCGLMIPMTSWLFAETRPAIADPAKNFTSSTASDAMERGLMAMDRTQTHFVCGRPTCARTS